MAAQGLDLDQSLWFRATHVSVQVDAVADAVSAKACAAGWQPLDLSRTVDTGAHILFTAAA